MKAREIFFKTLPFCWAKLGLGLLNIFIDVVLFAVLMGLSLIFKSEGVTFIMFLIWLAMIGTVNFIINHYFGYLVKAGHVAVIARTFEEGKVPDNCLATGKSMVKQRFVTSNAYFAIDKLVSGSVKQLQRALGRVTDKVFGAIPGADSVKSATNFFLEISLGYIDECCLGYTFYKDEDSAFKSACDGVVIYAQNWKTLLKNAAITALTVIVSLVVVTIIAFVIFGFSFRMLGWSGFAAFILSLMTAWVVKYAFIDSWMMVKMMHSYMQVAPDTKITFNLYNTLCGLSAKFRELFKKSEITQNNIAGVAPNNEVNATESDVDAPRFCSQCGTQLVNQPSFCGNCGTKVSV